MKTRSGFVSNSSSSSFVLALKELTEDCFLDALEIKRDSPAHEFVKPQIEIFLKNAEEIESSDFGDYHLDIKTIRSFLRRGLTIYAGSFSSEADDLEQGLCYTTFDINTHKIAIIKKEAGY